MPPTALLSLLLALVAAVNSQTPSARCGASDKIFANPGCFQCYFE